MTNLATTESESGQVARVKGLVEASVARNTKKAGKTEGISGHRLRVGSAQSLARTGSSLVEMQQVGRWQSPSIPARYTRKKLEGRGAVARLRYGK